MTIVSINQTLSHPSEVDDVSIVGGYIVLTYGDTRIICNDQGREVFRLDGQPTPPPGRWDKLKRWWTGQPIQHFGEF